MPNGRPGDHPLTDIVVHGAPVFTPEVDELIRQIVLLGGRGALEREIRLFASSLTGDEIARLRALLDRLRGNIDPPPASAP